MDYIISQWRLKGNDFLSKDAMYLRSMIGFHLHKECCLFEHRECKECSLNKSCYYCTIFEPINPERERGDRPPRTFRLSIVDNCLNLVTFSDEDHKLLIKMIELAGESGIGSKKQRKKFNLEKISYENKSYNTFSSSEYKGMLIIYFRTPTRFKENGSYTSELNNENIYRFMRRKYQEISEVLLLDDDIPYEDDSYFEVNDNALKWRDWFRYSSRQQTGMRLGGVEGFLVLKGFFSQNFMSLLEFCSFAGLGKNTSMGLGEISYFKE